MLGSIIGDIIGSRFERQSQPPAPGFELFTTKSHFTDDTVLTLAIAESLLTGKPYNQTVRSYARNYPLAGYGSNFKFWAMKNDAPPYNSWGNGSAMRVSPVAYAFETEAEVINEAEKTAAITHNHPEGIKGAKAIALAIFLARKGATKQEIKHKIESYTGYNLDRTLDGIRPNYSFDVSCQGSVPEAIIAFLESTDFESAIRLAISIGGDTDTIACMAGGIAEAFYGEIPTEIKDAALGKLDHSLRTVFNEFNTKFNEKPKYLPAQNALLGVAIGDALGVPFEFKSRKEMTANPATKMIGYGTYHQKPGTWSDDSSLTFCLADALCDGYDLEKIARNFIDWRFKNLWSARGELFDIGNTTNSAIERLRIIVNTKPGNLKAEKYLGSEMENGNGSLMRILPLLWYIKGKSIKDQFEIIWEVSALTHRHIRAAMCCLIYLKIAEYLLEGKDKQVAYQSTQQDILIFWNEIDYAKREQAILSRIIEKNIAEFSIDTIQGSGYVVEALEAALWCFLNRTDYQSCVFQAINLGQDTDTTAAIAGGLAGIFYGMDKIPFEWKKELAQFKKIEELGARLEEKYLIPQ